MKNYHAVARRPFLGAMLCAAFFALLLSAGPAAWAQGPASDPVAPPAYGIAQRLQKEAQAARETGQPDISRRRALQAVRQLDIVAASRTYGSTMYGREALRQKALLEEVFLRDKNLALQTLQTLHNKFPNDKAVVPELNRVGGAVDTFNQTITPVSTPLHVLGAVLYKIMDFLVALTGRQSWSYWFAIILVSILVKLVLTPLSNKQYKSMKEMQKLQPSIKELQAKYKNDKELLGRKMMDLYKDHGVNPAAGCLPLLVQMPILYTLYYMISRYQFQFSHGTFLWIGSPLAHLFPSYVAINLGVPDIPLLLLYAASMYVTQRMTITPAMDPQQAETQKLMTIMTPFMTTYFFLQYHLPSAFVLYYLIFNILSTAQQKYYLRPRPGDPVLVPSSEPPAPDRSDDGSGSRRFSTNGNGQGRLVSEAKMGEAKNGVHANGAAPAARGVIAPKKIHPKKKRR